MIKCSTLLLLRRIFNGKVFTQLLWAIGTFIVLSSVVQIIVLGLQCVPLKASVQGVLNGNCSKITLNPQPAYLVSGALNIATDWAMFCLPLPKLWKLNVCRKEKIQIIGIFLLGAL